MAAGTSTFPAALDTLTELITVVNDGSSTIGTGGVNDTDIVIPVTSTSAAPDQGSAVIVSASGLTREIVYYTSKTGTTLEGCTRGADNSTAAIWAQGDTIYFDSFIAAHHNVLADATINTQTKIGAGASTPTAGTALVGTGSGTSAWSTLDASAVSGFDEQVRDVMGTALVGGDGLDATPNDAGDQITLAVDATVSRDGHTHTTSEIIDFETHTHVTSEITDFNDAVDERARDAVGTAILTGTGISKTVDDAGNGITLAVDAAGVDHDLLLNTGVNTHAQIDTALAGVGLKLITSIATPSANFQMPNVFSDEYDTYRIVFSIYTFNSGGATLEASFLDELGGYSGRYNNAAQYLASNGNVSTTPASTDAGIIALVPAVSSTAYEQMSGSIDVYQPYIANRHTHWQGQTIGQRESSTLTLGFTLMGSQTITDKVTGIEFDNPEGSLIYGYVSVYGYSI